MPLPEEPGAAHPRGPGSRRPRQKPGRCPGTQRPQPACRHCWANSGASPASSCVFHCLSQCCWVWGASNTRAHCRCRRFRTETSLSSGQAPPSSAEGVVERSLVRELRSHTTNKSNTETNSIKTKKWSTAAKKSPRQESVFSHPSSPPAPETSCSAWSWLTHICTQKREGHRAPQPSPWPCAGSVPETGSPRPALVLSAPAGSSYVSA